MITPAEIDEATARTQAMAAEELPALHLIALTDLANRYRSNMQAPSDLAEIGVLIQSRTWTPGEIVVEIGTYHGDTAAFMATVLRAIGAPFVPVVSIDPFERCPTLATAAEVHGDYAQYALRTADFADQCLCIAAPSVQAAPLIPETIGLLLVDGSHLFADCLADLTLYVPKVVPGGIVVVDDDVVSQYPGVVQAVDTYFSPDQVNRTGNKAVVRIA